MRPIPAILFHHEEVVSTREHAPLTTATGIETKAVVRALELIQDGYGMKFLRYLPL
jgi:hypothetical protein